MKEILELSKKLIALETIPENPANLGKALDLALTGLSGYTIERFEKDGVQSALVYNSPARPKRFKIILNGHLDVIPAKAHQYVPTIRGNKLYGAGSMDMKANIACLIAAFKEVGHTVEYPLALQLVTDEETGGFEGTRYQIEKGVRADFVLAGEPTNFDIVHKAKGVLSLKISAKGKTAHGAYPWRGDNAIVKINQFLNAVTKKYPPVLKEEWVTTVNVSMIETSNTSLNKIPDDCIVYLDIRYVEKSADMIVKEMRKLLPRRCTLTVLSKEPALATDISDPYIKALGKVNAFLTKKKTVLRGAHGTSDARHYARVNCPGIEFGPIGGGIGSDAEWVDIKSLETYHRIVKEFLLSL